MMRSTGRARSKTTRDAQDRAKQITVANDFIEAFSDPETFESLSHDQMKVLNGIGLLPFILENKKQNITSV